MEINDEDLKKIKDLENNEIRGNYKDNTFKNFEYDVSDDFSNGSRRRGNHSIEKEPSIKNKIIILCVIIGVIIASIIGFFYFSGISLIEYKGDENITVEYKDNYIDRGIKVKSKFKDISNQVIIEGNVDTSKLGKYELTYKVPNYKGHKIYKRTVNVVDSTAPVIKINGDSEFELTYGEEFVEPGFEAEDNYDGSLTEIVEVNKVDIDNNYYNMVYSVTDSNGNRGEAVRKVKIVDNVAPKLTLKGSSIINIGLGKEYKEQGAQAIDNKDGDISDKIEISGNVDTSKDGTYTIKYSVSDYNGNKSEVSRKVNVGKANATGVVYLTFDDGPSSTITPKLLDILKEKDVHATFFIINYNEANEALVKREIEEGHSVGIHGYSHDYSKIYSSVEACYQNIIKLQEKIYNSTGVKTYLLRFPGGSSNTVSRKYCSGVMSAISKKVLNEGFKYYDWNVMSGDSGDVKTKEAVYNNVTKGLKPGRDNIVLMHDFSGNTKTLNAIADIIDYGLANGYVFEALTTDVPMVTQKILN